MLGPIQARIYAMPATLEERFLELTQPPAGTAVGGCEK